MYKMLHMKASNLAQIGQFDAKLVTTQFPPFS